MQVKPYEKLSDIYKGLMKSVDYDSWSNYILKIAEENVQDEARVLELASGNCKMAELISSRYVNFIATDISISMLRSAENNEINRICCDMTVLPIKHKFDFIFSAFDSVNYILKQKLLFRLFKEVSYILNDNGIFTFDASLKNNSVKFIKEITTENYYNDHYYLRINRFDKRKRIHYNNFIITTDTGKKFKEVHKQKIYDLETYFDLAEKAGLRVQDCYECFSFKDINPKSERAQFVMRKSKT